jgi:hypothetical protein
MVRENRIEQFHLDWGKDFSEIPFHHVFYFVNELRLLRKQNEVELGNETID